MPEGLATRFSHAIVRAPGESVAEGLRAVDRGAPDAAAFAREHAGYVAALERAGLEVETLPALEGFPDAVFVEDTALCLPEGAILLNPGTKSRAGEVAGIEAALRARFDRVAAIGQGTVDGGDVLVTDGNILVGLSARTDRLGFESLRDLLADWGHTAEAVETPDGVLHFKTDCGLLDAETVLATFRLFEAPCFRDFGVVQVPQGEEAAANAIRVNDTVLLAEGFPRTAELLDDFGYSVETVPVSQAALLDGGLSCMSLRYSAAD